MAHRIFISYFHKEDQKFKNKLVNKYDNRIFLDGSVNTNDIDETLSDQAIRQIIRDNYLRDTTVTILLLGKNTHKRKHIDWEVSSSLRNTEYNKRSGLLGILLPSHPCYNDSNQIDESNTQKRFLDNCKIGYAILLKWDFAYNHPYLLEQAIDRVFNNKFKINPDNSAPLRRKNTEA